MDDQIKEGDLYRRVTVFGRSFDLYYGYYEDYERESAYSEPIPIYPDFTKNPVYTDSGQPIVTEMQPSCLHYDGSPTEAICFRCRHFQGSEELFGLCRCPRRQDPEEAPPYNI